MEFSRSIVKVAVAATALVARAFPLASSAHDRGDGCDQHHRMDPEQRAKFARQHLEREAAMLEIKASQQAAWDAYVGARLDLMASFDKTKPLAPDADAAAMARQRADRAEAMAQGLGKLADATAKLQAALTDDQRKVLDRVERDHWHGGSMHHDDSMSWQHHHGPAMAPGMPKSAPKPAAPAKPNS